MNLLQNFHLAVIEYLYCGRRAVPLQTCTSRHSNRKLFIVMALSTIFTQSAPETTKCGNITQNKGHFAVHCHSRSPISVPIESSRLLISRRYLGRYCALSLEFINLLHNFHLAVIEYLYRGRRAVPLQLFTTRHSNRKLSIVMALSTTFTQCAPETTKFGKITQTKGNFAVQGYWRSPNLVPIESSYTTFYQWLILTYLLYCAFCEI